MYNSPYSFKIIALLLSAPLLTPSELLRLTLRWLTRATPSSAACVYFWHPPTSYLSTSPLSAHDLSHTCFRAHSSVTSFFMAGHQKSFAIAHIVFEIPGCPAVIKS